MTILKYVLVSVAISFSVASVAQGKPFFSSLKTQVGLGFNQSKGNTDKLGANGSVDISRADSIFELSIGLRYVYGENDQTINQREFTAGTQFDYLPYDKVSPFLRAEFYTNEFKKIYARSSALVGAKYNFYSSGKNTEYSLSAALQYDLEKQIDRENHLSKVRLSVRPKIKQQIMTNIFLLQEVYYKPNLNSFTDYLLKSITSVQFKVNDLIGVNFLYDYDFTNQPANELVKKTDTKLLIGLTINL